MSANAKLLNGRRRKLKLRHQRRVSRQSEFHLCRINSEALRTDIEGQLKHIREVIREHEAHIEALEHGDTFTPVLTGKPKKSKGGDKTGTSAGKKRKRAPSVDKPPAKRRRSGSDDDDFIDDDDDLSDFSDSDSESEKSEDRDYESSEKSDKSDSESDGESNNEDSEEEEEVTIESLKAKVDEAKEAIKEGRAQLNEFRKLKKEASDKVANLQKRESKAQREKNAFCSLKRSEVNTYLNDFALGDPESLFPRVFSRRSKGGFPCWIEGLRRYVTTGVNRLPC